jgi:hypothetical protein
LIRQGIRTILLYDSTDISCSIIIRYLELRMS